MTKMSANRLTRSCVTDDAFLVISEMMGPQIVHVRDGGPLVGSHFPKEVPGCPAPAMRVPMAVSGTDGGILPGCAMFMDAPTSWAPEDQQRAVPPDRKRGNGRVPSEIPHLCALLSYFFLFFLSFFSFHSFLSFL